MDAVRDYRSYAHQREVATRRAAQDRADAERHRAFDLMAQDTHVKSERAHFAVVTASEAFRQGYDRIFASQVSDLPSNRPGDGKEA